MTGLSNRESCRMCFRELKILPLQSQYLLSLLLFVVENPEHFSLNSEFHDHNTKNKSNLHLPSTKLTIFQKGPYYSGIKAFNNLPTHIKRLAQSKGLFKMALKDFLHFHSFYYLKDFYNYNRC